MAGTGRPNNGAAVALVAAATVLGVVAGARPIDDPDFFWHVRTGLEALGRRSTLPVDIFSYSFDGAPWLYKELLADLLFGLGYGTWGPPFVVGLRALVAVALAFAFWLAPPRGRRSAALSVVALAAALSAFILVERPNTLSFAFFAGTLAATTAMDESLDAAESRAVRRTAAGLAASLVVWSFLHRFVLLGFAVFGLFVLRQWVARRGHRDVVFITACFVASAVVALGQPHGWALLTTALRSIPKDAALRVTTEWSSLPPSVFVATFPVATAVVVAGLGAAVAAFVRRRGAWRAVALGPDGALAFLAVLFAVLTFRNVRWMPYAVIATLFILVREASAFFSRVARRRNLEPMPWVRGGVFAAATVASVLVVGISRSDVPFAIGEDDQWAPAGALAFARDRGLHERVVNSFDFGGYVILHGYPRFRVVVDGRNEVLYPPSFVVGALDSEHDAGSFRRMREADGADWALGTNDPGHEGYAFLARDPAWALVYWSDAATVYVRRDAYPELLSLRYRFIDPADILGSVTVALGAASGDGAKLAALEAELLRMAETSPTSARALMALAVFHGAFGPSHAAARDEALRRLEALHGDSAGMREWVQSVRRP